MKYSKETWCFYCLGSKWCCVEQGIRLLFERLVSWQLLFVTMARGKSQRISLSITSWVLWVIQTQSPLTCANSRDGKQYENTRNVSLVIPRDKRKALFCIVVPPEFGNKACDQSRRKMETEGEKQRFVFPQRKANSELEKWLTKQKNSLPSKRRLQKLQYQRSSPESIRDEDLMKGTGNG